MSFCAQFKRIYTAYIHMMKRKTQKRIIIIIILLYTLQFNYAILLLLQYTENVTFPPKGVIIIFRSRLLRLNGES